MCRREAGVMPPYWWRSKVEAGANNNLKRDQVVHRRYNAILLKIEQSVCMKVAIGIFVFCVQIYIFILLIKKDFYINSPSGLVVLLIIIRLSEEQLHEGI